MRDFISTNGLALLFAGGLFLGCQGSSGDGVLSSLEGGDETLNNGKTKVSVFLTDAPIEVVESVFVNVKQMELLLEKGGKQGRLIMGQDIGIIDLLLLRDGVLLPVAEVDMPPGVAVKQIRLLLHGEGNSLLYTDGSTCSLKTPSAQQTGIKIIMPGDGIIFEAGYDYNLVVDFDAEKSIVFLGNGGCLLKPTVKLQTANRLPNETHNGSDENTDGEPEPEDLIDEDADWVIGDDFDVSDPSTWPPGFTEDDIDLVF